MSNQCFELGLVGAGAVSAGAYTGGVIDFMVFALDQWYEAKALGSDKAPAHDVRISAFAGSSAGGITAALATGYLASDQPSIANPDEATVFRGQNKLFDSWVDRIDISYMLGTRDLPDNKTPVVSILDSTVLTEIAASGLDVTPRSQPRAFVAESFHLLFTVTNLRGVPYEIKLAGQHAHGHSMSLHADYVHFRFSNTLYDCPADCYPMTWADLGEAHPYKERIANTALASGAFPVGLAPRTLQHVIPECGANDCYSTRLWPVPTPESTEPHQCVSLRPIPATWGKLMGDYDYRYQCVDGGVMDNEPLELARRILAGPRGCNPREGEKADKAMILIDPFPGESHFDPEYSEAPDVLKSAVMVFTALKNQARFKPDELMLAAHDEVYSRFMIAPSRRGSAHPIACGALGGFGGFLKRDFRAHDYFLGRRNAQKFLRDHLVLPERNPLFNAWSEPQRQNYCVKNKDGTPVLEKGFRLLPIIPLLDEAAKPCFSPTWPSYSKADLTALSKGMDVRFDALLDNLVTAYFSKNNRLFRVATKWMLSRKKKDVLDWVEKTVSKDLKNMELMQ